METTNCWLQIEGWIFCLRCSLSGDMWTCWDFLWCLYFTSHLSALILYSKSDSPNIDTLTRVYYIHLVKWTKFFRKPVKKLPKYAQISSLSLQYKLKWSMMKDFSSENNWTNFAVSVRKTLHVFDLLSILTTLTWSSTFPLDFAILFKIWIFVVKQKLVEKLIHWPAGRRNEFVFCTFMSDLLFPWKPSGGVAIGPKLPLPWQPPPSKQWKLSELDQIDVWQV